MTSKKITIEEKDIKTATDAILYHLRKHGSITSLKAIDYYGVTRLSDTIWRLRRHGYEIVTHTFEKKTRYGRTALLAKYVYINPDDNDK